MPSTFFNFRRWTTFALSVILFFSVFAFGSTDSWALPVVAAGVSGLTVFWALRIFQAPYRIVLTWFYLPIAIVPAVAALQMLFGQTASRYRTAVEIAWWVVYLVYFFLLVNVLQDVALRRTMQRRLAYLGAAVSVAAIAQWMLSPRAAYGFREARGAQIFGPFPDAEAFAFLIELIFPGALFLAFRDGQRKLSLFASCVVMVAAVALSGSTVGQAVVAVELVIALAVSTYLAARSMSRTSWGPQAALTGMGALAVAAVVIVGFGADEVRSRLQLGLEPLATPGIFVLDRRDVFHTSWNLWRQEPVLGYGLGAFGAVFETSIPRRDGFHWEHGHTDPVELMVEIGVFGIAVQALLLAMILGSGRRDARAWVGVIAPLAAVWMHSWIRSPLRTPALVLTALTLLAMLPSAAGGPGSPGELPASAEE
jgi:hypothetical protein